MKYIIYEMDSNVENVPDGYHWSQKYRYTLLRLDISSIEDKHDSLESALSEIERNKDLLKFKKLTIIPVIDISWNGEMN